MITVKVYGEADAYNGFEVSGHAGYDDYGRDIVCASVSVLAINTINSIEKFTDDNAKVESKDGYLKLIVEKPSYEAELLINSFVLGITDIYEEYGDKFLKLVY
jgi:uncharacterized protein YsxB (DUF464 family)